MVGTKSLAVMVLTQLSPNFQVSPSEGSVNRRPINDTEFSHERILINGHWINRCFMTRDLTPLNVTVVPHFRRHNDVLSVKIRMRDIGITIKSSVNSGSAARFPEILPTMLTASGQQRSHRIIGFQITLIGTMFNFIISNVSVHGTAQLGAPTSADTAMTNVWTLFNMTRHCIEWKSWAFYWTDSFEMGFPHAMCPVVSPDLRNRTFNGPQPMVTQIARFLGSKWGPPGADRTQVGPMWATWTLLSGKCYLEIQQCSISNCLETFLHNMTASFQEHQSSMRDIRVPYSIPNNINPWNGTDMDREITQWCPFPRETGDICLMLFDQWITMVYVLTHWGRVMHICVSNITIIGSDNGLSPGRRQAIIWTNAGILLIGSLRTDFSEIWIKIQIFSLKKMSFKMSSVKCCPFRLGRNVFKYRVHYIYENATQEFLSQRRCQIEPSCCDCGVY